MPLQAGPAIVLALAAFCILLIFLVAGAAIAQHLKERRRGGVA